MQQGEEQDTSEFSDEVVAEIDVVYVPFPAPVHIMQYPLINPNGFHLNEYAEPNQCLYRTISKKLEISYAAKDNFTNLQDNPYGEATATKKKRENDIDEEGPDNTNSSILTYSSTLINNRTNYFVQHYDKESNKILWYAVDSFMQMRPVIGEGNSANSITIRGKDQQEAVTKSLQKVSKDFEREQLQMQRHPDKYVENKLKYYNSFTQVMDCEEPIRLQYISEQQSRVQSSIAKLYKAPSEIVDLKPLSKRQYQEKLESGGYDDKK